MTDKKKPVPEQVRAILATAAEQGRALHDPETPSIAEDTLAGFDLDGEPGTVPDEGTHFDPKNIRECASLDHSDTDNGRRIQKHFGGDILVLAQAKAKAPTFVTWDGQRWDKETGGPGAIAIAQKLGGAIALEVPHLDFTPDEQRAFDKGRGALAKAAASRSAEEKDHAEGAGAAVTARDRRRAKRMNHAVTSKNKGRIEAALAMLAPHVMLAPDGFNPDPLQVACRTHTLRFVRKPVRIKNPAWLDPDRGEADDVPEFVDGVEPALVATAGHERGDRITQLLAVDYKAGADCPKFRAFLDEFLPVPSVRRMVQVATGLGLLGLTVQRLFFHYGKGANGKSVFMETVVRVLGDVATTLPSETFVGEGGAKPGAQPDLVRLYGSRYLRVQELPQGVPLREELVKKLTGGEDFPVRDLFQGYFDFKPQFIGHMSGNGYPKIEGTDNGIWRRMVVVHWPKTIPTDKQREFEEVLGEFAPEYPGILNWMIEGALTFLREGLVVPEECQQATAAYRDEMDPTAGFCRDCVVSAPGSQVQARTLYEAYVNYATDRAERAISETRFAKIMAGKYTREDGRTRQYIDIALQNVPAPRVAPAGSPGGSVEDHLR